MTVVKRRVVSGSDGGSSDVSSSVEAAARQPRRSAPARGRNCRCGPEDPVAASDPGELCAAGDDPTISQRRRLSHPQTLSAPAATVLQPQCYSCLQLAFSILMKGSGTHMSGCDTRQRPRRASARFQDAKQSPFTSRRGGFGACDHFDPLFSGFPGLKRLPRPQFWVVAARSARTRRRRGPPASTSRECASSVSCWLRRCRAWRGCANTGEAARRAARLVRPHRLDDPHLHRGDRRHRITRGSDSRRERIVSALAGPRYSSRAALAGPRLNLSTNIEPFDALDAALSLWRRQVVAPRGPGRAGSRDGRLFLVPLRSRWRRRNGQTIVHGAFGDCMATPRAG